MRPSLFCLLIISVNTFAGFTYYVDPARGNDHGDGSREKPVRHIQEALDRADSSGVHVMLMPGVYTDALLLCDMSGHIVIESEKADMQDRAVWYSEGRPGNRKGKVCCLDCGAQRKRRIFEPHQLFIYGTGNSSVTIRTVIFVSAEHSEKSGWNICGQPDLTIENCVFTSVTREPKQIILMYNTTRSPDFGNLCIRNNLFFNIKTGAVITFVAHQEDFSFDPPEHMGNPHKNWIIENNVFSDIDISDSLGAVILIRERPVPAGDGKLVRSIHVNDLKVRNNVFYGISGNVLAHQWKEVQDGSPYQKERDRVEVFISENNLFSAVKAGKNGISAGWNSVNDRFVSYNVFKAAPAFNADINVVTPPVFDDKVPAIYRQQR